MARSFLLSGRVHADKVEARAGGVQGLLVSYKQTEKAVSVLHKAPFSQLYQGLILMLELQKTFATLVVAF